MAGIAHVEERGGMVYAYSVGGSMLWAKNGHLVNFSGAYVTIENCCMITTYDQYGREVG
ncbi:hypothetical protein HDR66_02310 [bacterium]|nr:hypothetical protein [bacterium]